MKRTMGIVGFGRFGRFAGLHLRDYFELSIFDDEERMAEAREMGFQTGTLQKVSSSSVILLCVPISRIPPVLEKIAPYLVENSLVVDTCSVKEYPVRHMKALLPPYVEILGTHPLFGPDSAASGLEGKKIVLCPVRIRNFQAVEDFLTRLGLTVLICSPEAHDRNMASTQAIVQFLGQAFFEMGLTTVDMATPGYETLMTILDVVRNDTWQLFCDLQTFNRFAKKAREKLIESLSGLNQKLSSEVFRRKWIHEVGAIHEQNSE